MGCEAEADPAINRYQAGVKKRNEERIERPGLRLVQKHARGNSRPAKLAGWGCAENNKRAGAPNGKGGSL